MEAIFGWRRWRRVLRGVLNWLRRRRRFRTRFRLWMQVLSVPCTEGWNLLRPTPICRCSWISGSLTISAISATRTVICITPPFSGRIPTIWRSMPEGSEGCRTGWSLTVRRCCSLSRRESMCAGRPISERECPSMIRTRLWMKCCSI